jgi:hypothetical protein
LDVCVLGSEDFVFGPCARTALSSDSFIDYDDDEVPSPERESPYSINESELSAVLAPSPRSARGF